MDYYIIPVLPSLASGPRLFKRWTALSSRYVITETNCVVHWTKIYPVDSVIQLLNNWGLELPSRQLKYDLSRFVCKEADWKRRTAL